MFVGEIGLPRREFLYDICFWEARRILRGYRNRYRDMWSAIRWHAYLVMGAMPYVDLRGNGIRSPKDLIRFPWDNDNAPATEMPTEEVKEELQEILNDMNNKTATKK